MTLVIVLSVAFFAVSILAIKYREQRDNLAAWIIQEHPELMKEEEE